MKIAGVRGRLAQEIRVGRPHTRVFYSFFRCSCFSGSNVRTNGAFPPTLEYGGILQLQDAIRVKIAAVLGCLAQVPHPYRNGLVLRIVVYFGGLWFILEVCGIRGRYPDGCAGGARGSRSPRVFYPRVDAYIHALYSY